VSFGDYQKLVSTGETGADEMKMAVRWQVIQTRVDPVVTMNVDGAV